MSQLDTLASQIPQELRTKLMQHFGIAKEYEKNPETVSITYYCLMYVANEALKLPKERQFAGHVIDFLEHMKKTYPNDEIIKSVAVGQETIEELITILVNETNEMTDDENRSPEHLRALMRKHYTVGGLSDVLSVFGPVKDDFVTLGRLAKNQAVAIFRDLKSGNTGPAASSAASKPHESSASARGVSPVAPPRMPEPSSYSAVGFSDSAKAGKDVPFDIINQAQKLCRYANSALEHEDVSTAVKNCEEMLRLLRPYQN